MDFQPVTDQQVRNPITPIIQIALLQFKDGISHIDKSRVRGDISEDEAHFLKNRLASIYADCIAHLVEKECQ